jgi:pSer/pThr/pTyr-binding forkhead associated (FHA) protein
MAANPPSPTPGLAEFSLTPQGEYAGKPPLRLTKPVVLVGSEEHCHLHLVSSSISRHHALIVREEDRVYICDLGSRTKVLINGRAQRETELKNGDEVRLGKFSFKFAASRPPAGPEVRPNQARVIVDGKLLPAPFENRLLLIGRTAGCDVMLVEESVSSRHAVIFEVGPKRFVRDLDSRTGTFLNGIKIHQHEIKPGSELRIGETILKLAEPAVSPEQPADSEEPLILEPEPEPIPMPAATTSDQVIPVEPPPTEPAEQLAEPVAPVAEHAPEEPLLLEPEPPPLPPAAAEDPPLQLEPEPEPIPETIAPPAPAAIEQSVDDTTLELEPESEPEPAEQAAPAVSTIDLSEAPKPKVEPPPLPPAAAEEPAPQIAVNDEPAPLELEPELGPTPETIAPPVAAVIEQPIDDAPLELEPESEPEPAEQAAPAASTIDLSDAPQPAIEPAPETSAAEISDEPPAPVIEISHEAEPSPSEAEPISIADLTRQAASPTATTIDLSDAPEPQLVAPETSAPSQAEAEPISETAQPADAPVDSTLNLLAEFATARTEEFKPVNLEPEPLPEAHTIEQTSPPSAATIDLSDAPELEPSPVPAIDLPAESESPEKLEVAQPPIADFDSKTVDVDVDLAAPQIEAEPAPIAQDAPPISPPEISPDVAAAEPPEQIAAAIDPDNLAEQALKKPRPGRPRQSPAEPKQPKTRRPRTKRVPPQSAEEESARSAQAPVSPESQSPSAEPPATEVPEFETQEASEQPPDSSPNLPEPVAAEAFAPSEPEPASIEPPPLEIPEFGIYETSDQPPDSLPSLPEPVGAEAHAPLELEPPSIEPPPFEIPNLEVHETPGQPPDSWLDAPELVIADAFPPVMQEDHAADRVNTPAATPLAGPAPIRQPPFFVRGDFAHLGGGTVNMDHFLGGMPIELQELPPAPVGFGQVRVDLSGKPSGPREWFSRPLPSVSLAPEPAVPAPPPLVPLEPEPAVASPPPEPSQPEAIIAPPPPPPIVEPLQPPAVTEAVPRMPLKPPPPYSTRTRGISADNLPLPGSGQEAGFTQSASAFDGLAPPTRETDVFSNFDTVPTNDAAFGGARLSPNDEHIVPDSPEMAARRASGAERDFAEDEFWNRTDEEDGMPSKNISPAQDDAVPTDPIPALPLDPDAQTAGSEDDSSLELQPSAATSTALSSNEAHAPPAISAQAAPARRRFRIPFLMPGILLFMALALGVIWRFMPFQSQIIGKVTFENYNWTPGTRDGTEFEAAQRRLLDSDQTRRDAMEILHRDHPDISLGFLESPAQWKQAVASLSLNSVRDIAQPQTVLQLSYPGPDKERDRLRMMALLQSLVDGNAPQLDANRRLLSLQQQAQRVVDDAQRKFDQIKTQLGNLQPVIDDQPPLDQLAQLTTRKGELQKARQDAEEALNRDRDDVARIDAAPANANQAASTTQPDTSDPQVNQARQRLADLEAEMDSARSDQVAAAILARQQLEAAAKQFNDQLSAGDNVLGTGSQLTQFVESARDSQAKARDLINMLIIDGEDLEKQLEDTRRNVESLIQSLQEQKWADDAQLQALHENLDSALHRYNANVGEGIKDPRILDRIQREIDDWSAQIKMRQTQLGVDPSEVKVQDNLNALIQSQRNKLQKQKQEIDAVLDPLDKQLSALDPVVAAMPQAQQALARQLRQRLDALNDARQKYAKAVGQEEIAPSAKVTELQKQIADLKDRLRRRQRDATRQKHAMNATAARNAIAADQSKLEAARNAYGELLLVFEEKQAEHDAAEAAQQKKISLLDDQRAAFTQLESAARDRDEKQSAAEHAFDIKPIGDFDVIVTSPADQRMMYSLYILGAGVIALAAMTFLSHITAQHSSRSKHPGQSHPPTTIADGVDSLVLPMAPPPSGSH